MMKTLFRRANNLSSSRHEGWLELAGGTTSTRNASRQKLSDIIFHAGSCHVVASNRKIQMGQEGAPPLKAILQIVF
jgi:hypothetical protein